MLAHFQGILDQVHVPELVQISMDGPNVNWKFYGLLDEKIRDAHSVSLLNVGSCGLHTVHNSFKAGAEATGWKVGSILSGIYYLFKDSPARREDFMTVTGNTRYPLKFVNHRWLENVAVSTRAIEIWDGVCKYVRAALDKKVSKPTCSSFEVVCNAAKDKLIIPKMTFFRCMAEHCVPFLADFQTDRPVIPFLSEALAEMIRAIMRRFIKPAVLDAAKTTSKLVSIDINDTTLHQSYQKIDIGFRTQRSLQEVKNKSDRDVLQFRMECKSFMITLLKKLLAKCPLNFPLVQALSCLNPNLMIRDVAACRRNFRKVLDALVNASRVPESECDAIVGQYESFLDRIPTEGSSEFSAFNRKSDRLDSFLLERLRVDNDKYALLTKVLRTVLVISHGQASVERGFSVNKEVEVENMEGKSLIAQRLVCDYVRTCGGVLQVPLTKELLQAAANSRQRYSRYLEEKRAATKSLQQSEKRKRALDELESLKKRQKRTQDDIAHLEKTAESISEQTEKSSGSAKDILGMVAEANALRRSAKEKKNDLTRLDKDIKKKQEELRAWLP